MSLVCRLTQRRSAAYCSVHDMPAPAKPVGRWDAAWLCPQGALQRLLPAQPMGATA